MSIESSLPLRIVPLGGLSEIGMNCMVLEYADEMLVIDCGLMFSELDHFGVQFIIPDFKYIIERKDKLRGFILTHGHEDHIGALVFAIKAGLNAPIYASPFTALLLTQKLREHGLESSVDLITFEPGQRIEFEYFKVQTTSVNHSIVDASALIIETPLGAIVHTGDFKIDSTPFYGRKIDEGIFKKYGDQGVLVLLSDSTNVERCTHTQSESVIYAKFEQLFAAAEGLTVIAMFASNVARMGQIFELAKKLGKRVAVSGRTMEQNVRLGMDTGYLKDALSVIIPLQDIDSVERKNVILVSSGSQAELGSSLLRVSKGDHKQVQVKSGDVVVMSSRYIPGNEKPIGKMINQLFMQGAHVLYEAIEDIHVSGHASKPELKTMLEWVRPKYFIPIHGEYRHLVHHAKLAKESGVREENAIVAVNGDVIDSKSCSMDIRVQKSPSQY
jgi:ribonuclease J